MYTKKSKSTTKITGLQLINQQRRGNEIIKIVQLFQKKAGKKMRQIKNKQHDTLKPESCQKSNVNNPNISVERQRQ